jgi:hypothetical protein
MENETDLAAWQNSHLMEIAPSEEQIAETNIADTFNDQCRSDNSVNLEKSRSWTGPYHKFGQECAGGCEQDMCGSADNCNGFGEGVCRCSQCSAGGCEQDMYGSADNCNGFGEGVCRCSQCSARVFNEGNSHCHQGSPAMYDGYISARASYNMIIPQEHNLLHADTPESHKIKYVMYATDDMRLDHLKVILQTISIIGQRYEEITPDKFEKLAAIERDIVQFPKLKYIQQVLGTMTMSTISGIFTLIHNKYHQLLLLHSQCNDQSNKQQCSM